MHQFLSMKFVTPQRQRHSGRRGRLFGEAAGIFTRERKPSLSSFHVHGIETWVLPWQAVQVVR